MSVPAWPAGLPQKLFVSGYSHGFANVAIKSDMDAGPPKVRRRFTAGVEPVSGTIIVTSSQLDTLDTFYNTTTLGGTLRFSWTVPPAHYAACEMRFTDVPRWTAIDPENYEVSLALEILP